MYSEGMEGLYYEDLSLFNGDLLLEDANEHLPVAAEQGLKDDSSTLAAVLAPPRKVAVRLTLAHPQNGSQQLGLEDLLAASPTQDLPDPFTAGTAWLDTKTDLVDLLMGVDSQPQSQQQQHTFLLRPASPPPPIMDIPNQDANMESLEAIQTMLLADLAPIDSSYSSGVDSSSHVEYNPESPAGNCVVYNPESSHDPTDVDMDILEELNVAGLELLLANAPEPNTAALLDNPILSPVSAADVDTLLSSNPPSPSEEATLSSLFSCFPHSSSSSSLLGTSSTLHNNDVAEVLHVISGDSRRPVREKARTAPYTLRCDVIGAASTPAASRGRRGKVDRRERKKEQNRTAASRYRDKKRTEHDGTQEEADQLMEENKALRDKADSIEREIKYLKDLMAEINQARSKKAMMKLGAF